MAIGIEGDQVRSSVSPLAAERDEATPDGDRPLVSITGLIRGDEVRVRNGIVGGLDARKVAVERSIVRGAFAGEALELHQAGANVLIAGGPVSLRQAGAQTVISNASIRMEQAGSGIAVGRHIDVADHGTVVFGVTTRLEIHEGGRVVFGPRTSLAVIAGLASLIGTLVLLARRVRVRD